MLLSQATVVTELKKPLIDERSRLNYGRLYLYGATQSFEYVTASFGGSPPIGAFPLIITSDEAHQGCSLAEGVDLTGIILAVRRGNCSFLTKATIAHKANATALIIVNTEDRLDSPAAGLGIDHNVTDAQVTAVASLPVITLSNTSWAKLDFTSFYCLDIFTRNNIN